MKKLIALLLVEAALAYLLISFVMWEMNPSQWGEETRKSLAIIYVLFIALPTIAATLMPKFE